MAAQASQLQTQPVPHCTEDRRPLYRVVEIPPITNTGRAPEVFVHTLHQEIVKQVKRREVWRVIPVTDAREEVVQLTMMILSWEAGPTTGGHPGTLEMKLSLIDKALHCEVNDTMGQGLVSLYPAVEKTRAVAQMADGAGWFVENVLVHNQFN